MIDGPIFEVAEDVSLDEFVAAWIATVGGTASPKDSSSVYCASDRAEAVLFKGDTDLDESPLWGELIVRAPFGWRATFVDAVARLRESTGWDVTYGDEQLALADARDRTRRMAQTA